VSVIDVNKAFAASESRHNVGSEGYQKTNDELVTLFKGIKSVLKEREVAYDFTVTCKREDFGTIGKGLRQHVGTYDVSLSENDKSLTAFRLELQSDVAWKDGKPSKVSLMLRFGGFDAMSVDLFKSEIHDRLQAGGLHADKWRNKSRANATPQETSYEYLVHSGFYNARKAPELPEDIQERLVDIIYASCETLDATVEHGPKPPEKIVAAEASEHDLSAAQLGRPKP